MAAGLFRLNWSKAEIEALAGKAARGAGAPPAQAARFGVAAAHHLVSGRDAESLERALADATNGPILAYPLALDAVLADGGCGALDDVGETPLLLSYIEVLPFAARLTSDGSGSLWLEVDLACPRKTLPIARITGCDALVAQMQALAARTLVPESEQSRAAGAGAGLVDND